MTLIRVEIREVYGKRVAYPSNDEAHWLADLAGSKTLTPNTLGLAERLGMTVETVGPMYWRDALGGGQ